MHKAREIKPYGGVLLELTLQLWNWLQMLGIADQNTEKKSTKNLGVSFPQQDVVDLSGLRSLPDFGLGCYSPWLDGKLPGQGC